MSDGARLNYDLFGRQLRDAIRGFELQTYLFAVNQRGGVQTDSAIVELLAFTSRRDFEALIARIESWPRKVDQTIELLHEAVARKRLWPQVVMTRVPAQIDRLSVAAEEHPFFAPFRSLPATIGAADAARLRDAARTGIATRVLPAQQKFRRFMTETYLPAAPGEVGLRSLPGGIALYEYFLRTNTTTSLDAGHIHALGLQEVARIRANMETAAPKTGYAGTLHDVFEAMRNDPRNFHATASELLDAYRALAKRIDPELVKLFNPLPRQPYGVNAIPAALAPDATTAYYQPG